MPIRGEHPRPWVDRRLDALERAKIHEWLAAGNKPTVIPEGVTSESDMYVWGQTHVKKKGKRDAHR